MTVVWTQGKCSVGDVVRRLQQPSAYTTVMTTLVRLVEKGLLRRKRKLKKFVYSAKCSEQEWQQSAAREAAERFLATPNVPRALLLSSLSNALAKGRERSSQ
jgi:predicted transcriptional regulator